MPARVAVVARSPLLGAGLVAALEGGDTGLAVQAYPTQLDEIAAQDSPPDLLVAEVADAAEALSLYERFADRMRLVLVGSGSRALTARALAERRPLGALSSAASARQVRAAVAAVLADLQAWDHEAAPVAAAGGAAPTAEPLGDPLTARELEVFELLAKGLSNRDIAGVLGISAHTAKFHVGQILAKIGAATRAEAVSIGLRLGLIGV
jgi:DNA-binding NarL/FixJ family response regulator